MAYTIKIGTISKHEESTKQPIMTGWSEYSVVFKDGADIVNPTITISADLSTLAGFNYAYMLGRYYWIRDISVLRTGYCILDLETDVLATYKSEIGDSNLYILRSASNSDGNIIDHYYPTASISYGYDDDNSFLPGSYGSGCYIVNVVGANTAGTSTLWKLTPGDFRDLIGNLYTNINGFQYTDISEAINKLLDGSPEKLVSSAMWLPSYNFSAGTAEEIVIGTWPSGVNGKLITDPLFELSPISLTLPKHPQAATRGAFLNLAPYTTYTLNVPMFGMVNIDTTAVKNISTIYVSITIDALSGQGRCRVYGGSTPLIADLTAQIGVPVPLQGQSAGASVAGGVISTLSGIAASIVSGGAAAPIIGAVSAGLGTAVTALSGASFSTGSGGGALSVQYNITLDATFLHIVDEDNTRNGRPYCRVAQPKNLSGFMLVQRGDVDIPGTIGEQQKIKMFLESGFFYE